MKVNEAFISIQGEGPFAGTRCLFIRFSGCNLLCPFCDSVYANGVYIDTSVSDIVALIKRSHTKQGINMVVFTGGEPTLYVDEINEIMERIDLNIDYGIETNGRKVPSLSFVSKFKAYVVSPKLLTDRDAKEEDLVLHNLARFITCPNVYVKPVVNEETMGYWMDWASHTFPCDRVIFMPETPVGKDYNTTRDAHDKMVREIIRELEWYKLPCRVGPRLHILYGVR